MIETAGWALVHSLWQGVVIAGLLALALIALRKACPQARYLAACSAMVWMLLAPLATALWQTRVASAGQLIISPYTTTANATPAANNAGADWHARIEAAMPILVSLWGCGVLLFGAYMFGGWVLAQRMRWTGQPIRNPHLLNQSRRMCDRLGVPRTVELLESALAGSPCVVGWIKPAILIPAGMLTQMPADQVEAILAHELAHLRRFDYAVNLVQCAAEVLLFYHPAAWWISGIIRQEREYCCDDLALSVTGNRDRYARALAQSGVWVVSGGISPASTGGHLLSRIRRVLGLPHGPYRQWRPALAALSLIALSAVLVFACSSKPAARADEDLTDPPPPAVEPLVREVPPPPPSADDLRMAPPPTQVRSEDEMPPGTMTLTSPSDPHHQLVIERDDGHNSMTLRHVDELSSQIAHIEVQIDAIEPEMDVHVEAIESAIEQQLVRIEQTLQMKVQQLEIQLQRLESQIEQRQEELNMLAEMRQADAERQREEARNREQEIKLKQDALRAEEAARREMERKPGR